MYNKALVAIAGGVIALLGDFGVAMPESIGNMVNAVVPLVTALLVYFVPNKG